jgi:hypothetical protein
MPARKGLLAPQNTFLDTIATRFDGTRELTYLLENKNISSNYKLNELNEFFKRLHQFMIIFTYILIYIINIFNSFLCLCFVLFDDFK